MEQIYFNPLTAYMGGQQAAAQANAGPFDQMQALAKLQMEQAKVQQAAQQQAQLQQLANAYMGGDQQAGMALASLDPQYTKQLQDVMGGMGGGDQYLATFGDSSEGRQLAILAKQYAAQFNVTPEQAIFEVARYSQEPRATPIAVPAGGAVSFVQQPTLFTPAEQKGPTVSEPKVLREQTQKELPISVLDAIQTNSAQLRLLKNIRTLIDNPAAAEALGPQNLIPGAASFGKYFRTGQQNDLLGMIAGLQSMTYKDISGANVTASEEPRLQQYVPAATDDPRTVRSKIDRFVKEYEAIQAEILANARAQGYKPTATQQETPQTAPPASKYKGITK